MANRDGKHAPIKIDGKKIEGYLPLEVETHKSDDCCYDKS